MKRNRKLNIAAAFLLGSAMLLTPGWIAWVDRAEGASDKEVIAKELATLFRSARGVISKNQKLINDKNKGDKGLSGKNVIEVAKQNYKKATHKDLGNPDPNTLQGELMQTMLRSIGEVMDKAQPLINRKGMGFKGFLPAVFAKQLADTFRKNANGKASIKLTAPKIYVRNRANAPDAWEAKVIETMFKQSGWPKGKVFTETRMHKGKRAFRLILPEYYKPSCLGCHGNSKGARDITGGKKEGGKLGELGGAISVAIYVQ